MSWRSEFGEEYAVPEEISKALYDASWHNDSAPSFWRKDDPASATPHTETSLTAEFPTYILWVEHPDPAQREMGGKRFGVAKYTENGEQRDVETIIETDDAEEALKVLMSQPMKTSPAESVVNQILDEDCHAHYEAIRRRVAGHIDAAEKAHHAGNNRAAAAQINGAIIYLQGYAKEEAHANFD